MAELLRIMTLNLHTYQEIDDKEFGSLEEFFHVYGKINEIIAKIIKEKSIDIICLQEAAQHKEMPVTMKIGDISIRRYNQVLELQKLLKERYDLDYNFIWDWSHYGWDVWEEGVGILTRFDIKETESRYVSGSTNEKDIFSRKVIKAVLLLPNETIDVYSAHLNWWEKGFKANIDNLFKWMSEGGTKNNFFLAGDFNNAAGDTGYNYFMNKTLNEEKVVDVDYKASVDNFYRPTIRGDYFNISQRIDYIITRDRENVVVKKSECVFNDDERVSDHMGVIAELEIHGAKAAD